MDNDRSAVPRRGFMAAGRKAGPKKCRSVGFQRKEVTRKGLYGA